MVECGVNGWRYDAGHSHWFFRFMEYFSDDPKDKQATLDWARSLHEALKVYEPLQRDVANIEHLLSAMLWPTSPFVRESLVGCYECNYKDFAEYTKGD